MKSSALREGRASDAEEGVLQDMFGDAVGLPERDQGRGTFCQCLPGKTGRCAVRESTTLNKARWMMICALRYSMHSSRTCERRAIKVQSDEVLQIEVMSFYK